MPRAFRRRARVRAALSEARVSGAFVCGLAGALAVQCERAVLDNALQRLGAYLVQLARALRRNALAHAVAAATARRCSGSEIVHDTGISVLTQSLRWRLR